MEFNKKIIFLTVVLVVLSSFLDCEVEARRKILRGRKTITRTYYRGLEIPGWVTVLLIGSGTLLMNAILFLVLKKWIILKDEPQPVAPYRLEHEV